MASSSTTEMIADSDQIVIDPNIFYFHWRLRLKVSFGKLLVDQILSQVKTLYREIHQSKYQIIYAPIFSEK